MFNFFHYSSFSWEPVVKAGFFFLKFQEGAGVLPAIAAGRTRGILRSMVPLENSMEASALGGDGIMGISSLKQAARTIADLEQSRDVEKEHLLEAVQHRRYGESDFFRTSLILEFFSWQLFPL